MLVRICLNNFEMMRVLSTVLVLASISVLVFGQGDGTSDCECVTYYNCLRNNTINKYGISVIDIRLGEPRQCPNIMDVCCSVPNIKKPSTKPSVEPDKQHVSKGCGYRNRDGIDFRITGEVKDIANEGEFPWMALILKKEIQNGKRVNSYKCGGALIHKRVILTAAHCIESFSPSDIIVRAGDWDTSSNKERLRHQDRNVSTIAKHPEYDGSYLGHDYALLILTNAFDLADNVEVVCLPERDEVISSSECFVTGWGKNKFGEEGLFSSILKAVKLPIVPNGECQTRLRETRLSKFFELHPSFICAGGVPGNDACQGDGGSPLVCPLKANPDRYVQAGVVAWGIGCNDDVPAAYANVALARPWIDETLAKYKINSSSYTA